MKTRMVLPLTWKSPVPFAVASLVLYGVLFLPFWKSLLTSFIVAAACAPLVRRLRHGFRGSRATLAYLFVGVLFLILVSILTVLAIQLYSSLLHLFENPETLSGYLDKFGQVRDSMVKWFQDSGFPGAGLVRQQIEQASQGIFVQLRDLLLGAAKTSVARAPEILLDLFIFLASFLVFLVSGPRLWLLISEVLGLRADQAGRFIEFESICAVAIGSLFLTGLLQATLVMIGSVAAGLGSTPLVFAATFVASMIPVLGAASVPIGLSAFCFVDGQGSAAWILLLTALITGVADNVLRAWLFSRAAKTHPVVSLIALLGAVSLFGFAGLILAPVIEQLAMSRLKTLKNEPVSGDDKKEGAAASDPRPEGGPATAGNAGGISM